MLTVFAISFLVLFSPVLLVRAAPEAAAILMGIGIIIFGLYYPLRVVAGSPSQLE